jgi:prevent-host-death family protein
MGLTILTNPSGNIRLVKLTNRHAMTNPINIYEAKTHLSALVERAAGGEEIIIAKAGTPRARLVAVVPRTRRAPGGWDRAMWIADDFDAPLPAEVLAGFMGGGAPAAPGPDGKLARRRRVPHGRP